MGKKHVIIRYLRIFFLSILIFVSTLCLGLSFTVLNKDFVEKQFDDNHYKNVEENIKNEMKRNMISSGISDTVIDSMFDSSDIRKTVGETLNILYENSKYKIDTTDMQKKLETNIIEDLHKKNYKIEDTKGFEHFTKSTVDIYEKEFIMLNQIQKVGHYMQKIIKVTMLIGIAVASIILVIVVARWKHYKRVLSPALFTNAFLFLFACWYINKEAGLTSITIFSETFSEVLRRIIQNTFQVFQNISYIYLVLGVIIIILFVRKHHKSQIV